MDEDKLFELMDKWTAYVLWFLGGLSVGLFLVPILRIIWGKVA